MDEAQFTEIMKAIFEQAPAGHGDFIGRYYTFDGLLAIPASNSGKVGFGIATGITPTPQVLEVVATLNAQMSFGHYWLTPGSDNDHWSLICGFKFPYESLSVEYLIELVVGLMKFSGSIVEKGRSELGDVPHRPYWDPAGDPGPQAIVLLSHLG